MTATDTDREVTALQVLRYPSGTTLRFVLLVVMVALSAVSVGNWTFLSTHPAFPLPSWQWLTIPPITILMVAAVLTAFAPVWLEHRRRWVAVPPDRGGAALARYDTLVAEAGLAATPPLVWNPVDTSSRALAYGLPGYYRVAVGPALLGAARRRPAAFDAVLRHELAHIRHRDVAIAYYAVIVWYVLIVVLAVPPLLWWVVDHDLSLVPEYVLRMVVLALLVYWVRSALLRVREHYADVRAGDSAPAQQALRAALNAPASTSWPRRMFSLHPTADSRINVLADPRGLARLETAELFAVGLTATWTLPLLYDLLVSLGLSPLDAPRSARILMFAMVGAYVGAVVARWAGCAAPVRDSARAAIGLVVGLSLGSVLSVGSTGLLSFVGDELAGMVLSAIIAGAYLFWAADLARVLLDPGQPHRRRVGIATSSVATTLVFALVVGASFAAVELVRLGGGSSALEVLLSKAFGVLGTSRYPAALAIVTALCGVIPLVVRLRRRSRILTILALGVGLGVFAALLTLGVRLQVDLHNNDDRVWRYYLAAVWIAVGAAVVAAFVEAVGRGIGRLVTSFLTAGLVTVVAACMFAAFEDIGHGSTIGIPEIEQFTRQAAGAAVLIAPVPAALGWLAQNSTRRLSARSKPLRIAAASVAIAAIAAVVIALVPGLVTGPPPRNKLPAAAAIGAAPKASADAYDQLWNAMPEGYSPSSCQPGDAPPPAQAAFNCSDNSLPGGSTHAAYVLLPDRKTLDDAFWATVLDREQAVMLPCDHGFYSGLWHNDRTDGNLNCAHYTDHDDAEVVWTSGSDRLLAIAHGPNLDTLVQWFTAVTNGRDVVGG